MKTFVLGFKVSEELLDEDLYDVIVRGAFVTLLMPSLRRHFSLGPDGVDMEEIDKEDQMAILHPDTSKIPIWRQRPTRMEHPITAWRCWGIQKDDKGKWALSSVTADCVWEGPVLRAHKRPVDPKYWDVMRHLKDQDAEAYYAEMHETFDVAGIYALKDRAQAEDAADDYGVSAFGEIALYGRVAQYQLGYRAEVCMIKRIYLRHVHQDLLVSNRELLDAASKSRIKELFHIRLKDLITDLSLRYDCEVTL